ncbi:MAG: DUF3445 domain-containing protein [Actinomycetota bacterium]
MTWLDELDLRPDAGWLALGTRALGGRPWLVTDDRAAVELELKARLRRDQPGEVFAAEPGTESAGDEVRRLVLGPDAAPIDGDPHPLDDAGSRVQEDLCLMRRRADGWYLAAGSVCFPSRWRLRDKLGRHVTAVHGPVDGYAEGLAARVDRLFDRLGERPVLRRNWFVHPDPALFQPDRPVGGDPVVVGAEALDELHCRSERQTLRRLPESGMILFTIRIQQAPLRELVADPARRAAFAHLLAEGPVADLSHRGLSPAQVVELRPVVAQVAA